MAECSRACGRPPVGWRCTRETGHEGPCAAVQDDDSHWTEEERAAVVEGLQSQSSRIPILQFFEFAHLHTRLADVSFTFARQALFIVENAPDNAERSTALRKLLEAKDCCVRARIAR
jgi:hypothetical protein